MIRHIFFALACFSIALSACAAGNGVKATTALDAKPKLVFMDGKTGLPVKGSFSSAYTDWKSSDNTLTAKIKLSKHYKASIYSVTISYAGKNPVHRLLQVALILPLSITAKGASFFDGLEVSQWNSVTKLERNDIEYTFPVSCIWNKQSGLAAGFTPDTLTSSLYSGVRVVASRPELFYQTKVVVDSNHPQNISFITYKFKPTFGHLDAIQLYYDMFPKWFRPVDNVDQRIYGCGGYFIASDNTRRLQLHTGRRVGLDWEWVYAPWVRSADYYPEKQDWVEGRDVIRNYQMYNDEYKGSWEEYTRVRKAGMDQGDKTTAMFYYLLVKDGNLDLVTREYPDAQSVLKNGQKSTGGMNAIPGEKTTYIFPYGTAMSARIEDELRKVVDNYKVSGFAFDMANHGIDDYGPAQLKYGVARSFDENGNIYTPDTLLGALFADAIHKMSRDGKRMGVIMNQAISRSQCFAVFHADGVMYEQGPAMNARNVMPLRLMSGRKPMTFWGSVECARLNGGVRWDYMADPVMAREIKDGLTQHYLLTCLRIGASPMTWAARDLGYDWMPTLIDLKKAGWNPVPAVVSSSKDLWVGRFGSGSGTIITISNPKRNVVKSDISIISSYLGKGSYMFVSDQRQRLLQTVNPENTRFKITLQPKEAMVLRAYSLPNLKNTMQATTSRDITTGAVNMQLKGNPRGFVIAGIAKNHLGYGVSGISGVSSSLIDQKGSIRIVAGPNASIKINYKPASRLLSNKDEIIAFYTDPYKQDNAEKMCIVIPDDATRDEMTIAQQLESYWSFIHAFKERPVENEPAFMNKDWANRAGLPIVKMSEADRSLYRKQILVGRFPSSLLTGSEKSEIKSFDGGYIKLIRNNATEMMWIGGRTDSQLRQMANIYFRLMDNNCLGDLTVVENWVPGGY